MAATRILHVVNVLSLAGMEHGVIKLVNRLDRARFEPMICCLRFQREAVRGLLDGSVPVFELDKRPGWDLNLIFRLAALLKSRRVDLVHSHNRATFLHATAASVLSRKPVVHGEHGRESPDISRSEALLGRCLARGARRILTVNAQLRDELITSWMVPPARVTCIPNGVDLDAFGRSYDPDSLRRELGLAGRHRVILNIGRFRPVKDHPTLIRAFARLHGRIPETRLILVGDDFGTGYKAQTKAMAAGVGIDGAILFVGTRRDIPQLMSLSDVYVNTSLYEGMSNTILEAMASRKPVVATSAGGNPELVQHGRTGFLFDPGDDATLSSLLETLLCSDDLSTRFGLAARHFVETRHSIDGMVDRYSRVYEEVLADFRGNQ